MKTLQFLPSVYSELVNCRGVIVGKVLLDPWSLPDYLLVAYVENACVLRVIIIHQRAFPKQGEPRQQEDPRQDRASQRR
jgi:hypothetical protein